LNVGLFGRLKVLNFEKHSVGSDFPVVGIGASAGGLKAIEAFLGSVPASSGMAYVIVQHLSPSDEGRLVEILRRATPMPVHEIVDRTAVEPDCVYVIPPDRELSLRDGVLHVDESAERRGLRLPIDIFFRSLAIERGRSAVAVVLSGMGSDGTLGLAAVREHGGAVFVQEPATADFDAMPRSAIDAGIADVVTAPSEMPMRIASFLRRSAADDADRSVDTVLAIVRARTGNDFTNYKRRTVVRRIDRRLGVLELASIGDYVDYLTLNPQEAEILFKELLIGVTSFFRDPSAWDQLVTQVWPSIIARVADGAVLRAWTPGCSTGEEAYSLAMSFLEARDAIAPTRRCSLQVFATDLDASAIDRARAGDYSSNIVVDVSSERLARFFVHDGASYRITTAVREMVIFAPHNVTVDPPFTRLDLITCRNLLIYLEPPLQQRVLGLFHYALHSDGVLMLGTAETPGESSGSFAPLPLTTRCYRRTSVPPPAAKVGDLTAAPGTHSRPAPSVTSPGAASLGLQSLAEALLLRRHAPAAVLTTRTGDIVYFSGDTGPFLTPPAGRANLNLFAMARPGLDAPLEEAFRAALRDQRPEVRRGVYFVGTSGSVIVDLTVEPVDESSTLNDLMLVAFTTSEQRGRLDRSGGQPVPDDVPEDDSPRVEVPDLEDELARLRAVLQATRAAMQASHEQLQAANEEFQSTNEELQSTNEELTTSKEEMQSMNEELQTVNQELESRVDELVDARNDLLNLLNSTSIATLFLDSSLRIRRYTPQLATLFKLIPRDIGRSITDLVSELDYPDLADDAREVLRTLIPRSRCVATKNARWFDVKVMPYRTQDDRIDGVALTFIDCTDLQAVVTAVNERLMVSDRDDDSESRQATERLRAAMVALADRSVNFGIHWSKWADRGG
jgi:two-component system CheB/CheR fusion protein